MIRRILFVVSLCVATLVNCTALAGQTDDNLEMVLEEIRNLKAQMQRLEKKVDGLLSRLDRLEGKHAHRPNAAATTIDERPKRLDFLFSRPPDPVSEVLRLQFHSPNHLLDGIHEREERLRRRQFPPEIDLMPIRD